ncbi:MAG: hypothetical protein QOJ12_1412, partial [Thermoleophilales bacterium]|nr:hypothetical protein [Thermoleophilales bacterium]
VVVKPVGLSASRGVIRADDEPQFDAAVTRIRAMFDEPDSQPLLVESFVPGVEVAVEGLLRGGELEILAVFDKPDPLDGPFFEETIYVTPSRLPSATLAAVEATASAAAAALGLTEGPVHAELRVDPVSGDVTLLELAARSIGGLCSRALRFGAGVSLEEVILRHALDEPLSGLERADAASGVMMLPIPRAGVLREVRGVEAARAVPGIVGLDIGIAQGRPVEPLPEGDRYLGFLFARGQTPAEVEGALREASALLDVDIRDAASLRAVYSGHEGRSSGGSGGSWSGINATHPSEIGTCVTGVALRGHMATHPLGIQTCVTLIPLRERKHDTPLRTADVCRRRCVPRTTGDTPSANPDVCRVKHERGRTPCLRSRSTPSRRQ